MRTTVFLCAALAVSLSACGGGESGSSTTTAATSGSSSSGAQDPCEGVTATTPSTAEVVINEINALGATEWVEIANKSDQAVDLSCHSFADSTNGGGLDLDHALRFPPGSKIDAKSYVLFVRYGDPEDPPVKHQGDDCGVSTALDSAFCYYVTWEISNKNGGTVWFLAPSGEMITNVLYPPEAIPDPMVADTWARLPDLTGDFMASTTASPGGPNLP